VAEVGSGASEGSKKRPVRLDCREEGLRRQHRREDEQVRALSAVAQGRAGASQTATQVGKEKTRQRRRFLHQNAIFPAQSRLPTPDGLLLLRKRQPSAAGT
jgi:hypothetical protein